MYRIRTVCIALLSLVVVLPHVAAAYTVAPLALNLNVERRDIINETIVITNPSDRQIRVYPSVHEVSVDGEGVVEAFTIPDGAARAVSPTSWIEISRGRIVVGPGERIEVPFTIRMNPYTEPGEYSVFIGMAEASNQPQAVEKVMAGNVPGTLINLIVDRKQSHFLRLESFRINRFVTNPAERTVTLSVHNPGDVPTTPAGEVIFYDSKGREVGASTVNNTAQNIAPDASASYEVTLPDGLSMGRYKAYLAAEYGDTMRATLHDTSFFYVVSIPQLIGMFVGLFVVALLFVVLLYRRSHQSDDSEVPLYVQEGISPEQDHDVNLKDRHE